MEKSAKKKLILFSLASRSLGTFFIFLLAHGLPLARQNLKNLLQTSDAKEMNRSQLGFKSYDANHTP